MQTKQAFDSHLVLLAALLLTPLCVSGASLPLPQSWNFGTSNDNADDFTLSKRDASTVIQLEPSGLRIRTDADNANNDNAQAAAEFTPLSQGQNIDFEMEASISFPNDFDERFARVGLTAFTKEDDDSPNGALIDQGMAFVLYNNNTGPTELIFQSGFTGTDRFGAVTKQGLTRGQLTGQSLDFHVSGSWDAVGSEWSFVFSVTDPDGTQMIANSGALDPTASNKRFTGNFFGFGAGAGGDGYDVVFENFSIIPEPDTYALFFGVMAIGLTIIRRRI